MTKDEILEKVKQKVAGVKAKINEENGEFILDISDVIDTAALAAMELEREACAKVCANDKTQADEWIPSFYPGTYFAASIRARK